MEALMDATTVLAIANQSITLLTFFVASVGVVVTEKIVESGFEKGKHLYHIIFHRFQKVPDQGQAVKVLEDFKNDPEEHAINLRTHLVNVLQADPQFANQLRQFLQQGVVQEILVSGGSVAQGNKMTNTTGRGIQRMQADNDSHLEDNQMHMR
jgi:hypothetical protein